MPLLDLKTTLKDLKFGTVAPYIQKDINNPGTPSANQIQARIEDLSRLTLMLGDQPGARFATNLVALEASKADTLADILTIDTVTNPALRLGNMLAQVPVNRTGTHFLALDGGPLYNYYARNSNAAAEALSGTITIPTPDNRSKVKRSARLAGFEDGYENPKTRSSREAKVNSTVQLGKYVKLKQADGTYKEVEGLTSKYAMPDKHNGSGGKDAVNLLDVGSGATNFDLMPVMFSKFGSWDTTKLLFRGFLQNFADNFNSNWQSTSYVGRMEQFFTYTGFSRNLTFQLVVPIFSEEEQPTVYNKLNSLASYTAPTYLEGSNLPQGNIANLVIGNYIRTSGILNSVSYTVTNDVPWSYSSEDAYGSSESPRLLPQVITVNLSFTPIHAKAPSFYGDAFSKGSTQPYLNHGTDSLSQLTLATPTEGLPVRNSVLDPVSNSRGVVLPQLPSFEAPPRGLFKNLGNLFKKRTRASVTTDDVEIYDIDNEFTGF